MPLVLGVDGVTLASFATAGATLVLAVATFASVRSGNRSARLAEQSLLAGLWPVLTTARPEDPDQKVMFVDDHKLVVPGGGAAAEATDDAIYLAIAVRNVGPGLAVLDRWWLVPERLGGDRGHAEPSDFHRLTRDLYIPPGEFGFWQGTFREPGDPEFVRAATAIRDRTAITVDLLYGDHLGAERTVTRFVMLPRPDDRWYATVSRHWNLDRPDPR